MKRLVFRCKREQRQFNGRNGFSRRVISLGWVLLCLLVMPQSRGLTIIRDFWGGTPATNVVGGGNLEAIFNAAADYWELAILDEHVVTLHYGWAPLEGSNGVHYLNAQSGTPNRETEGTIYWDNDGSAAGEWYLDPTPYEHEEYRSMRETGADLGGGAMSVARYYYDPVGEAAGRLDLLMQLMHEIGHALGMSINHISWQQESRDRDIDVTAPRPFAGSVLPLATNINGVTSHLDVEVLPYGALFTGGNSDERRIPSAIDILANAQVSQFTKLNLDLKPVLQLRRSEAVLTISWSVLTPGYVLEQNANVENADGWKPVTGYVGVVNGKNVVTVPKDAQHLFFRLRNG